MKLKPLRILSAISTRKRVTDIDRFSPTMTINYAISYQSDDDGISHFDDVNLDNVYHGKINEVHDVALDLLPSIANASTSAGRRYREVLTPK